MDGVAGHNRFVFGVARDLPLTEFQIARPPDLGYRAYTRRSDELDRQLTIAHAVQRVVARPDGQTDRACKPNGWISIYDALKHSFVSHLFPPPQPASSKLIQTVADACRKAVTFGDSLIEVSSDGQSVRRRRGGGSGGGGGGMSGGDTASYFPIIDEVVQFGGCGPNGWAMDTHDEVLHGRSDYSDANFMTKGPFYRGFLCNWKVYITCSIKSSSVDPSLYDLHVTVNDHEYGIIHRLIPSEECVPYVAVWRDELRIMSPSDPMTQ